jgi:hypothetical protein
VSTDGSAGHALIDTGNSSDGDPYYVNWTGWQAQPYYEVSANVYSGNSLDETDEAGVMAYVNETSSRYVSGYLLLASFYNWGYTGYLTLWRLSSWDVIYGGYAVLWWDSSPPGDGYPSSWTNLGSYSASGLWSLGDTEIDLVISSDGNGGKNIDGYIGGTGGTHAIHYDDSSPLSAGYAGLFLMNNGQETSTGYDLELDDFQIFD